MIEVLVTSTGLLLGNAEMLWVQSYHEQDPIYLIVGTSMEVSQGGPQLWHHFVESECHQWNPEGTGCLASTIQIDMTEAVVCDVVAWSEAENRQQPDRKVSMLALDWMFHPADIDMDGEISCADREAFAVGVYDWNLDGQATAADTAGVATAVSRALADLDADGIVDTTDLLLFWPNWGDCSPPPGQSCMGDLTCNGVVDVEDFLTFLSAWGT